MSASGSVLPLLCSSCEVASISHQADGSRGASQWLTLRTARVLAALKNVQVRECVQTGPKRLGIWSWVCTRAARTTALGAVTDLDVCVGRGGASDMPHSHW
jgi:hypothetical protein